MAEPTRPSPDNEKNRYRRGSAFKVTDKGALYLEFEPGRITALRPVPVRAWATGRGNGATWFGVRDVVVDVSTLIRAVRAEELANAQGVCVGGTAVEVWRRRNFRRFLADVPADVQALCGAGWAGNTWPVFRLLATTPAARDVCASQTGGHVVVALSLAHRLLPSLRASLPFARRWASRPRKEILGRLGFPGTNAAVGVLAKIPRGHVDEHALELARDAMNDADAFKRCCHLPRLPRALLAVLRPALRPYVGEGLIASLVADDTVGFPADALAGDVRDSIALSMQLGKKAPVFTSRAHVKAVHDALVVEARKQQSYDAVKFPSFPAVLTQGELAWVRPLTSALALSEEGALMHHCLGTLTEHVELARAGVMLAFAVEYRGQERLTLAIVRHGAVFMTYDFRGPGNCEPSAGAVAWAKTLVGRLNDATGAWASA